MFITKQSRFHLNKHFHIRLWELTHNEWRITLCFVMEVHPGCTCGQETMLLQHNVIRFLLFPPAVWWAEADTMTQFVMVACRGCLQWIATQKNGTKTLLGNNKTVFVLQPYKALCFRSVYLLRLALLKCEGKKKAKSSRKRRAVGGGSIDEFWD